MKLSTAIRIGSMTTRQIKFLPRDGGNGRCALGAALDAVGLGDMLDNDNWLTLARFTFPISGKHAVHPVNGHLEILSAVIWDLNDHHSWTREQIADYVERIENEKEEVYGTRSQSSTTDKDANCAVRA